MKNIVIVGCGKGIGLATAKILSKEHHVTGISKSHSAEAKSLPIHFHEIDVVSGDLNTVDFPETIDGLVYAPGSINLKPFNRLTESDFRNDFEINVLGAVKCIQKFLPHLKKSDTPSIVLFSSVAAKLGMPFHASIAASKSAVEGLTKSLAAELASQNIRVNAIAPSLTETPLAAGLLSSPERKESAAKRHPINRIGTAEEMAEMAAFLLSDKATWMTGQVIGLDGGMGSVKL